MIITVLKGAAVGVANIIPGVSGGTMALMLGIYERLIGVLSGLGPGEVLAAVKSKEAFQTFWRERELTFLISLGVGAILAVVALSKVMKYFLAEAHDPTYGFFFGLVFASILVPWKMIRAKSAGVYLALILGAGSVVGISTAMSPEARVEAAEKKLAIKQSQGANAAVFATADYVSFFIAGAIAISAMILPGLSGSFILLLLGIYFQLLEAISQMQIPLLAVFAAGCGIGLLLFTRILHWLLEKFHDGTMAYLTGLVVGSLYAVWPFKDFQMVGDSRIDKGNILPAFADANTWVTLGTILAGVVVVAIFMKLEPADELEPAPENP